MTPESTEVLVRFLLCRMALHMNTATSCDFGRIEELAHILTRAMHDFIDIPYTNPELETRCIELTKVLKETV